MTEQDDRGFAFALEETELGSAEYREKNEIWRKDMESVIRFSEVPTIHKSNLLLHGISVQALAFTMMGSIAAEGIHLDGRKISRMSLHHDDAEKWIGDYPSPKKAAFTEEERQKYHHDENEAMIKAADKYMPESFRQLYLDDWIELQEKQTPEAQIVEIADKWDGLCETLTDIRCGNNTNDIFEVVHNYQVLFEKINKLPIMQIVKQNPLFGLHRIPNIQDAKDMSPIDLNLLSEEDGKNKFWRRVFDPSLPPMYKHWLRFTINQHTHDFGKFPRWKEILAIPNYKMTGEERWEILDNFYVS